jgi:hypothetical protein
MDLIINGLFGRRCQETPVRAWGIEKEMVMQK